MNVACQSRSVWAVITGDTSSQLNQIAEQAQLSENSLNPTSTAWNVTVAVNGSSYRVSFPRIYFQNEAVVLKFL